MSVSFSLASKKDIYRELINGEEDGVFLFLFFFFSGVGTYRTWILVVEAVDPSVPYLLDQMDPLNHFCFLL